MKMFVWFKTVEQHGMARDNALSCQVVYCENAKDKTFMPKGVVAKHEISEAIDAGNFPLAELAVFFPAPEAVDAQG